MSAAFAVVLLDPRQACRPAMILEFVNQQRAPGYKSREHMRVYQSRHGGSIALVVSSLGANKKCLSCLYNLAAAAVCESKPGSPPYYSTLY